MVAAMIQNIRIETMANGGDGIGRIDGKTCFIPYSVTGDLIDIRITESKKRFSRGEIVEIIEPSPFRTEPFCPHFGICGGCTWQHIAYDRQLRIKEKLIRSPLERIGGLSPDSVPEIKAVQASPDIRAYRNSVRFHVDSDGNPGFFQSGSHSVVPIDECPVSLPDINRRLAELRSELGKTEKPPVSIQLYVTESRELLEWKEYPGKGKDLPFHQINHGVNALLREKIAELTAEAGGDGTRVLDLYSGDGNLSLNIPGAEVVGVESNGRAVRTANKGSDGGRQKYIREEVERFLRTPEYRELRNRSYTHIIADPPRTGLKGLTDGIAALQAPAIFYVSCSPPDLARDAASLLEKGYILESVHPFDMFPHTAHIETIAVFRLFNAGR